MYTFIIFIILFFVCFVFYVFPYYVKKMMNEDKEFLKITKLDCSACLSVGAGWRHWINYVISNGDL